MLTTSYSPPGLSFDADLIGPWVCQGTGATWVPGRGTAIGQIKNNQLTAGVLYEDFTGANVVCHIRGDPGWANRRFLHVIFHYPFLQMKVRRITVPVDSHNLASINLVVRMGFKLECTLEQATPRGDLHLFRMFRDECQYLKGKYGKE